MTASFMPCCNIGDPKMNSQIDLERRTFLLAVAAGLLGGVRPAWADEDWIFFTNGTLSKEAPGDAPGLYINASFAMNLPSAVSESLLRGVALYFVTEFQLTQRRWYWKDKTVASASSTKRLSYSLLTRKYYIGGAGLSLSFASLEEALSVLSNIRRWAVAPPDAITGDFQDYQASLRLYLDRNRLPRPLQLGISDWEMTSDWISLPISPSVVAP